MATADRIALVGARGMLGRMMLRNAPESVEVISLARPELDVTDRAQVFERMTVLQPKIIVNCSGYTKVDQCESEEDLANRVNGHGPGFLAEAAREVGATLVHISSDYVFDGRGSRPYREEDPTGPQSAYGRSKLRGEQAVLASGLERFYIVRTSWLYGPGGPNFVETILRLAGEREEVRIVSDQMGSPTYTRDLAGGIFQLLKKVGCGPENHSSLYGIYHFANQGQCSWFEFAEEIIRVAKESGMKLKVRSVVPIRTEEYPVAAPRPAFSVLSTEKYRHATGMDIPAWQESLRSYLKEMTTEEI